MRNPQRSPRFLRGLAQGKFDEREEAREDGDELRVPMPELIGGIVDGRNWGIKAPDWWPQPWKQLLADAVAKIGARFDMRRE